MTARVFAVHQPTGYDPDAGRRPSMDLSPALRFGSLGFVFGETENPFRKASQIVETARDRLTDKEYGPQDYLLLIGNPILIGAVAVAAGNIAEAAWEDGTWTRDDGFDEDRPFLRMLQWSRAKGEYHAVEVRL